VKFQQDRLIISHKPQVVSNKINDPNTETLGKTTWTTRSSWKF